MKNKSLIALLATTPIVASLGAIAFATNNNRTIESANAVNQVLILEQKDLNEIALEDIDLGKENPDKKFTINIGGGRYIAGAIVFGDCGHQFAGDTLGSLFGIDNRLESSLNAYNFQIIFSLEASYSLSFNLTEYSDTEDETVYTQYQIKYGGWGGDNFYNTIKNHYDNVTKKAAEANSYYSQGNNAFLTMDATSKQIYHSFGLQGSSIAAIQVTYGTKEGYAWNAFYAKPGNLIQFALNRLEITYYCK